MTATTRVRSATAILFITAVACNIPAQVQPTVEPASESPTLEQPTPTIAAAPPIEHVSIPAEDPAEGTVVHDVESSGTGPDKRAPYGDSYDINLLERPFLQDMTYVPDLDIKSFQLSRDDDWHYVHIKLIGNDPNNPLGIHFGVELDTDKDGFGNFIIWAGPPYAAGWTTENVRVFADQNHDTSGISATESDAPYTATADGYETPLFDGALGLGDDPDLAWVRRASSGNATLQFAFKRSLAGDVFLAGVLADAGLKDVAKLDYVDRFTEAEAGSSVRDKREYPLKALYSVDNTCRGAFGFTPTGDEDMLCPSLQSPGTGRSNDRGGPGQPSGCQPPGGSCDPGYYWWPDPHCACSITPYTP
jgi:hypothetical protein